MHRRRAGDAHVHLGRAGFADHLHDLQRRGAAHDRIVDEHDALAGEHVAVGVVLEADAHVADGVGRLDEGAADVVVADDAEIEGQAGGLGVADRRRRAGIRAPARRGRPSPGARGRARRRSASAPRRRRAPRPRNPAARNRRTRRCRSATAPVANGNRLSMPSSVMTTISPGLMSRTKRAPMMSRAQVSEARIVAPSRSPRMSGRTPSGSRQPIIFLVDRQTSDQAPSTRFSASTMRSTRRRPRRWWRSGGG